MTKEKKIYTFDDLLAKTESYIKNKKELDKIKEAYLFAAKLHQGQKRKTGDDYITHPLSVAIILSEIYSDVDTIIASLLHDTIEYCDIDRDKISEMFGNDVGKLVYGVTKLSKLSFSTENEYLVEYYKKIIVGMSEDARVIIIKLADCLHNMRTLWAIPIAEQKLKAKEVLEIFAPIAHHLGINRIKSELEDLSLRYSKPDVYYDIAEKLNSTKIERDQSVNNMMDSVTKLLNEHHIKHEIKGRSKSIYSIYNKLDKGRKFSDIYDLLAMRILVDTEQDCYLALGIIHSKFKPIPKRFKDFIAMPKVNMYQSLHTAVFGLDGNIYEVQIRTYGMNEIAENGIASHWAYKENRNAMASFQTTTEQKLQFFKSIIELNTDKLTSEEFVNSIKDEVLNDSIYCFTPKGDVIELPKNATPIDFAYKVHTKIGETMVGALVNDSIVPLNYKLKDNDIVKINTNKSSAPKKEWLKIVRSTQTKNKIKAYFTKTEKDNYIEKGKYLLEKELHKRKIPLLEFLIDKNVRVILKKLKLDNLEDIYLNIGNNKYGANTIIGIIYKENNLKETIKTYVSSNDTDIIVEGINNVRVKLSACCAPIPGDAIVGYISKNEGIKVHRLDCSNLSFFEERTVAVKWDSKINLKYDANIIIYTIDYLNHVSDIIQKLNNLNVSINRLITLNDKEKNAYELNINVSNLEQLNKIVLELNKLDFVNNIKRI